MSYRMDSYDPNGGMLADEEERSGNYFLRHWRGHLSLPQSYWLNGFLTNVAIVAVGLALVALEQTGRSLRLLAFGFCLYVAAFLIARTWSLVGIWRSAGRHSARGGAAGWGVVARVLVGLGVVGTAAQLPALGAQAKEFGLIAIGRDPLGPVAKVALDASGETLTVEGILSAGVADSFEKVVAQAPKAKLVVLDSDGGRIFEALRMAEIIKARGLETRVEQNCASACTFLLLAGKDRSAHRFAQIGFHQPDFPGLSARERTEFVDQNRKDYIGAGMDPAFVERAMRISPNEMWYPTHAELVEAGVITSEEITVGSPRFDLERLQVMLRRLTSELNASRGTMIDEATRLDGASLDGNQLRVRYGVLRPIGDAEGRALKRHLTAALSDQLCNSPRRSMIEMGASFGFDYLDQAGSQVARVTIERCPPANQG